MTKIGATSDTDKRNQLVGQSHTLGLARVHSYRSFLLDKPNLLIAIVTVRDTLRSIILLVPKT